MGCDIHSFAEVKRNGKWERLTEKVFKSWDGSLIDAPFDLRNYSVFGFLADVRNYSDCKPLSQPKGFPQDSEWLNEIHKKDKDLTNLRYYLEDGDYHSHSFFTLKELVDFDYEQTFEDGRAEVSEEPKIITYREHLWEKYFDDIDVLKTLGEPEDVRVVFWFDN
jgi:hypothetical protein